MGEGAGGHYKGYSIRGFYNGGGKLVPNRFGASIKKKSKDGRELGVKKNGGKFKCEGANFKSIRGTIRRGEGAV